MSDTTNGQPHELHINTDTGDADYVDPQGATHNVNWESAGSSMSAPEPDLARPPEKVQDFLDDMKVLTTLRNTLYKAKINLLNPAARLFKASEPKELFYVHISMRQWDPEPLDDDEVLAVKEASTAYMAARVAVATKEEQMEYKYPRGEWDW